MTVPEISRQGNGAVGRAAVTGCVAAQVEEFARQHRYRLRNLHNGAPVPPFRAPRGFQATGYAGASRERWDAIIGQYGYVAPGETRLEWMIAGKSERTLKRRLPMILAAGGVVEQAGDTEAAGWAPLESLAELVRAIDPYRLKPGNDALHRARPGAGIDDRASSGTLGRVTAQFGPVAELGGGRAGDSATNKRAARGLADCRRPGRPARAAHNLA